MKTIKVIIHKYPIVTALVMTALCIAVQNILDFKDLNKLTAGLISEAIIAAMAAYFLYLINGSGQLRFSTIGVGYSLKLSWSLILIAFLLGGLPALRSIGTFNTEFGNPFIVFVEVTLYAICIGIFEEFLFRGILLSAFLDKFGNSFSGILFSCIASGLLFGVLHVLGDLVGLFTKPETATLATVLQILAKTLQTGIFGFVLGVVVLRTHNLWSVSIVHSIYDYVTILPSFLFGNANPTNYVQTGDEGYIVLLAYGILLLAMLPAFIYAFFQSKQVKIPQWGLFKVQWVPQEVPKTKRKR